MTNKNLNMFQSPGPSQSYARMHALYGATPGPAAFMPAESHAQHPMVGVGGPAGHPHAHTAFKAGAQATLSAPFGGPMTSAIHHTDSKKNLRGLALSAMPSGAGPMVGGPGGSGEVATPVFKPSKNAALRNMYTDEYMAP